jgi:transposase
MLMPSQGVRILVATRPVDFRKGHDGLASMVQSALAQKYEFWGGSGLTVNRHA